MRRNLRLLAVLAALMMAAAAFLVAMPQASAQDIDEIVAELESRGYYIEPGGEGTSSTFADLVRQSERTADTWYFLSMADTVSSDFADDLYDVLQPRGNVLVYFLDGDFANVQLATESSDSIETTALAPFDGDWRIPEDFMADVVTEYDALTVTSTTGGTSSNTGSSNNSGTSTNSAGSDSGGGFPWLLVGIPAVFIGGFWFMSRRGKKKKAETDLETAQKIRAELQTEIDELANDVLVLSGPIDLSEKPEAIDLYREATDTYLTISDETPEMEDLQAASLSDLATIGTRVAHARWQMDAAEAILDGDPIPEKPKVAPPPPPPTPPEQREQQRERQRQRLPQRQARPRVPYSSSRRRSGGGLLDILIAGGGMMAAGRRRGGGMFGGGSRSRSQPSRTQSPRPGGGVFGSSSRSRSSSRRSTSRSSSRRTSSGRSTSKRRRR